MDFVPKSIAELGLDHAGILYLCTLQPTAANITRDSPCIINFIVIKGPIIRTSTINPFSVQAPSIRAAWIWVGRARFGSKETKRKLDRTVSIQLSGQPYRSTSAALSIR